MIQELTREELMTRCSERMELTLDDPKAALPILDQMGFTNYQVVNQSTIHIYERLNESAAVNMELAKAGVPGKRDRNHKRRTGKLFLESDRRCPQCLI